MAMVVDAFVNICINKLAHLIEERVVMMLGVKDELNKLKGKLETVIHVLKDAERRRIQDLVINSWLSELKDVMYEADDIIDLCRAEGGRLMAEDEPSTSLRPRVRCGGFPLLSCFGARIQLRYQIGIKIRSLNKRLEELSNDNLSFKLVPVDQEAFVSKITSKTSPLVELDTVGMDIDEATDVFVELLNKENEQLRRLFAITGMGGIGKTTLAKKIFNDQRIMDNYQIRMWVCVSQKFSEIDLLKQMIRCAGMDHGQATEKAELEPMLRTAVEGKSVFLVLDDVWQADVWVNLLRNPLGEGAAITRILITTRDINIAKQMGAVYIYQVELLPDEEGWELLFRSASLQRKEEIESLRGIGIEIVRKCQGLPLAIKTVGGVLITKEKSQRGWEKVLKNDAWTMSKLPEQLRGALYLSYEDLPSRLKQCFLYLALFPANYLFYKPQLVRYWVAEGFVENNGDEFLEETAEGYYAELMRRNILQLTPVKVTRSPSTMHDLLRSLAQFLARDECFYGDVQEIKAPTKLKLRRLSIADRGDVAVIPEFVLEQSCLRTLMLLKSPSRIHNDSFIRLQNLRLLILNGTGTQSIPDSVGNLIHLRFVDLSFTKVSKLPETIGRLTNLQELDLVHCQHLYTLPQGITRLCSLRRLGLYGASLKHLPKGISKLRQLNSLSGFVVSDQGNLGEKLQVCDLKELKSLSLLRYLTLDKLERATSGASVLLDKPHLKALKLFCTPYTERAVERPYLEDETVRIEHVFDKLTPPPRLEKIRIFNFFGRQNPIWMKSSSLGTCLPYLRKLSLHNFASCLQLPPLGELPHLQSLKIEGAFAVASIGPEFLGNGVRDGNHAETSIAFPKLQLLKIERMPNWEEWSLFREVEGTHDGKEIAAPKPLLFLPHLGELVLTDCPKLKSLPRDLHQATILKSLHIEGAHKLKVIEDLPSLSAILHIENNRCLERISNLLALRELNIVECPSLECVENVGALRRLQLRDAAMECLPPWLFGLIQQQSLRNNSFRVAVSCNVGGLERCLRGGQDWHIVEQIPFVSVFADTEKGRLHLRYNKESSWYETNLKRGSLVA